QLLEPCVIGMVPLRILEHLMVIAVYRQAIQLLWAPVAHGGAERVPPWKGTNVVAVSRYAAWRAQWVLFHAANSGSTCLVKYSKSYRVLRGPSPNRQPASSQKNTIDGYVSMPIHCRSISCQFRENNA